jgi:hypothetical protein
MTAELLSPAEAALLLDPSSSSGGKCLQAALLALLARDHIRIGETDGFFKYRTMLVRDGDGEALPPHLSVVKHVLMAEGRHRVLKSNEVAAALHKAFGSNYRRYVHDKLAPGLISRGLITREDRKWLGLIPYVKYERTAEGERRNAKVAALMDELSDMKQLVRHEPDRARRLAEAAGVLLVLSPAARAQAAKLEEMVRRQDTGSDGGGTTGGTYAERADEDSSGWELGVDIGNFSFGTDAFAMLDGVSSVGDFTGGDGGDGGGDGGGGGD